MRYFCACFIVVTADSVWTELTVYGWLLSWSQNSIALRELTGVSKTTHSASNERQNPTTQENPTTPEMILLARLLGNREARTSRGKVAESLAIVDPILTCKFKTIPWQYPFKVNAYWIIRVQYLPWLTSSPLKA